MPSTSSKMPSDKRRLKIRRRRTYEQTHIHTYTYIKLRNAHINYLWSKREEHAHISSCKCHFGA